MLRGSWRGEEINAETYKFLGKKMDEEGQHFCVLTINYQLARIFNFLIQKTFKLAGLFKGIIENTLTLFYILMKYLPITESGQSTMFLQSFIALTEHRLSQI